jgi:predicted metal-dependent phosphoesterase TrpH
MRGVLHVHSVFSDGEESLERIVPMFKEAGMSFIAVSDHAEVFDAERMKQYVAACDSLSSSSFIVIPGLEFAFKGGSIHILGYGITQRVRSASMEELVDGVHEGGGLAVLAHPPVGSINMVRPIQTKLDGIEVWNGRYDGTITPRAESFQLLRQVRSSNGNAVAYGGVDFHKREQIRRPVYVDVEAEHVERAPIIDALRGGRFSISNGKVVIPASGKLTFMQELSIAVKQPLCRAF